MAEVLYIENTEQLERCREILLEARQVISTGFFMKTNEKLNFLQLLGDGTWSLTVKFSIDTEVTQEQFESKFTLKSK